MTPAINSSTPELKTETSWFPRPRHANRIALASVCVGVVMRWAIGDSLGLGFFISVCACVIAFAVVGRREAVMQARPAWAWAITALFFASMVVLRDSNSLIFFDVLAVCAALALALRDAVSAPQRTSLSQYVTGVSSALSGSAAGSMAMVAHGTDQAVALSRSGGKSLDGVIRGVALTVPIVGVLAALLASGDSTFSNRISSLIDHATHAMGTTLSWFIGTSLFALITSGTLAWSLRRSHAVQSSDERAPGPSLLGVIEGVMVLGSIAALFGTFLLIQVTYLFAGDPSERGNGMTYASYAVDGTIQLTIVAVITWLVVEGAQRWIRTPNVAPDRTLRSISSLILGQALVILASAHLRLAQYEDTYGYTLRRIFGHGLIAFLGACLIIRILTLWTARTQGANWVACAGIAVLAALNILNPEAVVVRANAARNSTVVTTDWKYLALLSADAMPELAKVTPPGAICELKWRMSTDGLPGFNISRQRAADLFRNCPAQPSASPFFTAADSRTWESE